MEDRAIELDSPMKLEEQLYESLGRWRGYVVNRVRDPDLADDLLQDSLIKAVNAVDDIKDESKIAPWFRQILNHVIADYYRRKNTEQRTLKKHADEYELAPTEEDDRMLCGCFKPLLPTLKPEYSEVIQMVDLEEIPSEVVAKKLGISRSTLKVRRHRARNQLRKRLLETCRVCAEHGCLDCNCKT